jgi:competence protein ComEC
MTQWSVKDDSWHTYVFPEFTLGVNMSVTLHTYSGTHDATNLYWCRDQSVWNNEGDTVYLRDSDGYLVDFYRFLG